MKKISSDYTWLHKRLFPWVWFGFLGFFLLVAMVSGGLQESVVWAVGPILMGVFGFFMFRAFVWDLMDEVHDCTDFLLVRNRGDDEHIVLSDIMNVSMSTHMNPARITLRLVRPSKFGSEIAFSPAADFTLNPFAKNAIAEDLIVRVDAARSRRRGSLSAGSEGGGA